MLAWSTHHPSHVRGVVRDGIGGRSRRHGAPAGSIVRRGAGWGGSGARWGGSGAGPHQLGEHIEVDVLRALDPYAAPADVRLRQSLAIAFGQVETFWIRGGDVERDVSLLAGQADREPVSLAA